MAQNYSLKETNTLKLLALTAMVFSVIGVVLTIINTQNVKTLMSTYAKGSRFANVGEPTEVTLAQDESVKITCESWSIKTSRKGRQEITVSCVGLPNQPPPQEPPPQEGQMEQQPEQEQPPPPVQ